MWWKQIGATCKPLWLFFHLVLSFWCWVCWVYWLGRPWATWKLTCVVWLFDFIKNCWFQLFNYFRIREPPILILWKKLQNQRSTNLSHTQNLKKPTFFHGRIQWIGDFMARYLIFSKIWKSWLFIKSGSLNLFRIMIMNNRNHPDNGWGSFLVLASLGASYKSIF